MRVRVALLVGRALALADRTAAAEPALAPPAWRALQATGTPDSCACQTCVETKDNTVLDCVSFGLDCSCYSPFDAGGGAPAKKKKGEAAGKGTKGQGGRGRNGKASAKEPTRQK